MTSLEPLVSNVLNGDRRSLGKILTIIEEDPRAGSEILSKLLSYGGNAHVIGITGIPGSGKSTLISKLITYYTRKGKKVAVIAIDPTSPYSRGALLGDRIRMQEHSVDPNVFIRSVSTRGLKGGLSLASLGMIEVFDSAGYDKIIIESVGVGQGDVDIMYTAHTLVVVTMPGVGDEIQALKAGIMEIGDIYVLNKSDRHDATKTYEYLEFAMEIGEIKERDGWKPKLIKTSAIMGKGINELAGAINEHLSYIKTRSLYDKKILLRRKFMLRLLIEKLFIDNLEELMSEINNFEFGQEINLYDKAIKVIKKIITKI